MLIDVDDLEVASTLLLSSRAFALANGTIAPTEGSHHRVALIDGAGYRIVWSCGYECRSARPDTLTLPRPVGSSRPSRELVPAQCVGALYHAVQPPSTRRTVPVTLPEASQAR